MLPNAIINYLQQAAKEARIENAEAKYFVVRGRITGFILVS